MDEKTTESKKETKKMKIDIRKLEKLQPTADPLREYLGGG